MEAQSQAQNAQVSKKRKIREDSIKGRLIIAGHLRVSGDSDLSSAPVSCIHCGKRFHYHTSFYFISQRLFSLLSDISHAKSS